MKYKDVGKLKPSIMAGEFGNRRPLDSNLRAINVYSLLSSDSISGQSQTTSHVGPQDVYEDVYLQVV